MNTDKPRYQPVSVQDVTDYDPMKGTIRAKRVNYKLADGTQSYVVIPHSEYNAETVENALHEAANRHDEVMSIRGTPGMTPITPTPNPFG